MDKELLYKAEGVKDCVKWLIKQIKLEQKQQKQQNRSLFWYNDTTDYNERINTMINIKIGLEKYAKKLKHQSEEI